MQQITAYSCDYCQKIYRLKSTAKSHEKRCYYNPATKSCATCIKDFNCPLSEKKAQTNCNEWEFANYE